MLYKNLGKFIVNTGIIASVIALSLMAGGSSASAHQDPLNCNASGLQQFPSVTPSTVVYDGTTLTYTVIYVNSDPDGAGPVSPCNLTGLNASIDLPGPGNITVLTNATLPVGASISCPGGPGCAPGPYTYTVNHADEVGGTVTAGFHINGVLHQSINENTAADDDNLSSNVIHPSTLIDITSSAAQVISGGTVNLTVTETNDGTSNLTNVSVTVDNGVGTLNSASPNFSGDDGDAVLEPGETWMWLVNGVVVNTNTTFVATGSGTDPLGTIITFPGDQDERDSVSVTTITPSTIVDISSSASTVPVGGTVNLTVTEQNDGTANLTNVHVDVDNGIGSLTSLSPNFSGDDGDAVLEPGETWMWLVNGVVINASTTFMATGFGTDPGGTVITYPGDQQERDSVTVGVEQLALEGCTPGYWKQSQHFDSWVGFSPTDSFSSVFGQTITINVNTKGKPSSVTDPTLLQALEANGGGINALARHAVASLLNSSKPDVDFALTTAQVLSTFNAAFASGNFASAQTLFATNNELGCPLN